MSTRPRDAIAARLRTELDGGGTLSPSGPCRTWRRLARLADVASRDLSVGRLFEGHIDALGILEEAGSPAVPGALYGVWAARSGEDPVCALPVPGGWRLTGTKPFCSGAGMLDRALVTAEAPDGYRLFDIVVADQVERHVPGSWPAVGMADSASDTLVLGGPAVPLARAVGPPGFYLDRAGFWPGAIGVAAAWYGGARGLVEHLGAAMSPDDDPHALAELGRAVSRVRAMSDVLQSAARRVDAGSPAGGESPELTARATREIVHDLCLRVLAEVASAGGAGPLCHDGDQARRAADLYIYLAQHHARDPAAVGRLAIEGRAWGY